VLYPKEGPLRKDAGVRVTRIGPLQAWSISYSGDSPVICLKAGLATYACCQPAATFKKLFVHLKEQAEIVFEVCANLSLTIPR
jgi:hypothetical protein